MNTLHTVINSGDKKRIQNFLFYLNDYFMIIEDYVIESCESERFINDYYYSFKNFNEGYNYIKEHLTNEIVENIMVGKLKLNNPILSSILIYYDRNIISKILNKCKSIDSISNYDFNDLIELLKVLFVNLNIELINKNFDDIILCINIAKSIFSKNKKTIDEEINLKIKELFKLLPDNSITINSVCKSDILYCDILIELDKIKNKDTIYDHIEKCKKSELIEDFNLNFIEIVKKYIEKNHNAKYLNIHIYTKDKYKLTYIIKDIKILKDENLNNEVIKFNNSLLVIKYIKEIDNENIKSLIEKLNA